MLKKLVFVLLLTLQIGAVVHVDLKPVPSPRCFPCGN